MNLRYLYVIPGLLFVTIVLFLIDLYIGSADIPFFKAVFSIFSSADNTEPYVYIIKEIRFPRVVTALFAGMALAVAGLQMQTIFRNPLAGPYVLGISSGSSLGVALVILGASVFGYSFTGFLANAGVVIAALTGAAFILLLILSVSVRVKDVMTILILGILFGGATSAIVSVLQFFSSEYALKSYVVWTLGSLSGVTSDQLYVIVPLVVTGLTIAFVLSKKLDTYLLGEYYAKSLGSNVFLLRLMSFISTCLLAGTVTAFCGPLGFIGIAAPHISRMLLKSSKHITLIISSVFTGSVMMLTADILSQLPGSDKVLPINSVTALLGIPVVIWIIARNYRYSKMM